MTTIAASSAKHRIDTLDIVRGIAVMGILVMNIAAFAMPYPAYANPAAYGGDSGANLASWVFNFILFDGKMRGLFSILFGASTLLVIERATDAGRSAARTHYARMIVLLGFGLVHFYFIWWGDVLVLYALCGMLLYLFRNRSPRALTRWAIALLSLSIISFAATGLTATLADRPGLPAATAQGFAETRTVLSSEFGAGSPKVDSELRLYRSDYASIVDSRLSGRRWEPFQSLLGFGLETVGLMLLGMALFRSGFLTGDRTIAHYRTWAIRAALIAIPPLAFLAWWQISANFDAVRVFVAFLALSVPFDVLLAVGWAAAIIWWVKVGPMPTLKARVAAAGRMAFTNYLATSIIMSSIFYGYGLGLFGAVSRAGLWPFVLGMWGLILLWSKPWLDRFNYGPLEWLWRSLARGQVQPMRKA
ncbi:DUF418 domain-containing protein [Sphingomonas sp.]|uniref:DUF418 domain-containing protein n=1 Tax=Sphingomonas sp. TaxID=28214 RepID=UPI00286D5F67|nr:DUF418 domain-containing protein [Sphingomonas sp.]